MIKRIVTATTGLVLMWLRSSKLHGNKNCFVSSRHVQHLVNDNKLFDEKQISVLFIYRQIDYTGNNAIKKDLSGIFHTKLLKFLLNPRTITSAFALTRIKKNCKTIIDCVLVM